MTWNAPRTRAIADADGYSGASDAPQPPAVEAGKDVPLEMTFSGTKAAEIAGITDRQLDFWARIELVRPTVVFPGSSGARRAYSYRDLLELRLIKRLIDHGLTLDAVRDLFGSLRNLETDNLANVHLVLSDTDVVLGEADACAELTRLGSGQLHVLALASIKDEVDAALVMLRPARPA